MMVLRSPPIGSMPSAIALKPSRTKTPNINVYTGRAARLRRMVARLRAASAPVSVCG
jgi:hypothetical protein